MLLEAKAGMTFRPFFQEYCLSPAKYFRTLWSGRCVVFQRASGAKIVGKFDSDFDCCLPRLPRYLADLAVGEDGRPGFGLFDFELLVSLVASGPVAHLI